MRHLTHKFCCSIRPVLRNSVYTPVIQNKRNYPAVPKRFYRRVDVVRNGNDSYEITLDQRKLKTPQGNILKVYNETLALAVAAEWDGQKDTIQRNSMHLTALCNTIIDNPCQLNENALVSNLINYLDTDAILYHCNEDDELYKVQLQEWSPIIDWFNRRFQVNVTPARDLSCSQCDANVTEVLQRHLRSYSFPCLQGLSFAVESLKSLILALCCVEREISVEKAVLLSRLEEDFQIKKWGRIEWAHDMNFVDMQSRVSAAVTFIHLHFESSNVHAK